MSAPALCQSLPRHGLAFPWVSLGLNKAVACRINAFTRWVSANLCLLVEGNPVSSSCSKVGPLVMRTCETPTFFVSILCIFSSAFASPCALETVCLHFQTALASFLAFLCFWPLGCKGQRLLRRSWAESLSKRLLLLMKAKLGSLIVGTLSSTHTLILLMSWSCGIQARRVLMPAVAWAAGVDLFSAGFPLALSRTVVTLWWMCWNSWRLHLGRWFSFDSGRDCCFWSAQGQSEIFCRCLSAIWWSACPRSRCWLSGCR